MQMSYSKADLLSEELFLLSESASLKDKLFYKLLRTKKVPLIINIPQTYLARARILCDDLERITEEEVDIEFLIEVVLQDFVYELAKLNNGPLPAFQFLMDR